MTISQLEIPAVISAYLKTIGMRFEEMRSLRYHEYSEEKKPLMKMAGIESWDDQTWYATVLAHNLQEARVEVLELACDAKTGECRKIVAL